MNLDINRTLRLPRGQFFEDKHPKRQVYVHHTVGGNAGSTFDWWLKDPQRIGTAYLVERDGTIYEVFPPECWAHHIGRGSLDRHNQQSIGIELCSEGALRSGKEMNKAFDNDNFDEQWLYAFNAKKLYHVENDAAKFVKAPFRGFDYFDAYEPAQLVSACWLAKDLCSRFAVPATIVPFDDKLSYHLELLDSFQGVLGHANVRLDKTDPHPGFDWKLLRDVLAA